MNDINPSGEKLDLARFIYSGMRKARLWAVKSSKAYLQNNGVSYFVFWQFSKHKSSKKKKKHEYTCLSQ